MTAAPRVARAVVAPGTLASTWATGATARSPGRATPECSPGPDDEGCVGTAYEGENIPLDIYVMFDLSCSMSCSVDTSGCCRLDNPVPEAQQRIQPVRQAMKQFLQDLASVGIGVGLGFFGDHDRDARQRSSGLHGRVARRRDGRDPAAALRRRTRSSPSSRQGLPQGGTETHLAIRGSCQYVDAWRQKNPGRKTVILLVTDGIPERACGANIELATAAGPRLLRRRRRVRDVRARRGRQQQQLPRVAQQHRGGGRHRSRLPDRHGRRRWLRARCAERHPRRRRDPCDLQLPTPPDGETLNILREPRDLRRWRDSSRSSPSSRPTAATVRVVLRRPNTPETIHLCEATCEDGGVPGATLFFSLGCATKAPVF